MIQYCDILYLKSCILHSTCNTLSLNSALPALATLVKLKMTGSRSFVSKRLSSSQRTRT